jgi:hypothetical protein
VKIRWNTIFNSAALLSVLVLIAGFQSTFWFQLFGNTPAPLLWINMMVYVALYRKPFPAVVSVYVMGFILLSFTAMPLKMMWISLLVLFVLINGIKSRVFWSGSGYYTIMCAFAAVAYHIIYFSSSMLVEKNPASFELVDRLVQIILTPSFAFPMYWMLAKIDKLTQDELVHEPGGLEL